MHYRVHSTMVKKCERWYSTKAEAIAAFERASKRKGIASPRSYPPGVSGDSITTNDLAYPRRTCAAGMREGHGCIYVAVRNDVEVSGDAEVPWVVLRKLTAGLQRLNPKKSRPLGGSLRRWWFPSNAPFASHDSD